MEFYTEHPFNFDEDTTDTEDDSGIAEISSSVDYANDRDEGEHDVSLDSETLTPVQQSQPQDALGRFFSYW